MIPSETGSYEDEGEEISERKGTTRTIKLVGRPSSLPEMDWKQQRLHPLAPQFVSKS